MKKMMIVWMCLWGWSAFTGKAKAQTDEIAQLLLNVEKLSQFKQILKDMKNGYQVISNGYGTIKNISQGNFSMHEAFLNGLLSVSPAVRQYGRIADIIQGQLQLLKEYRKAYGRFQAMRIFQPQELSYMSGVYDRLVSASLQNIEELTAVITDSKLRMSDDERIKSIDRIHAEMEDKLRFLRKFNNATSVMGLQRKKALAENQAMQKNYGIN